MAFSTDSYFDRGMTFFEEERYEQAAEMFTRALRLSLGDLAEMLLYRGICYAYIGDEERALADFNGAIQRNADLADAYNERGTLLRLNGDDNAAIADYTVTLKLDPRHDAAYFNRALTYEQQRRYQEACDDLDNAIALNPTIATAYEARGRVRARLRQFDGAIQDFERYLRMGGGREFDNHSEIQSYIIQLRINKWLSRIIPARFLPDGDSMASS